MISLASILFHPAGLRWQENCKLKQNSSLMDKTAAHQHARGGCEASELVLFPVTPTASLPDHIFVWDHHLLAQSNPLRSGQSHLRHERDCNISRMRTRTARSSSCWVPSLHGHSSPCPSVGMTATSCALQSLPGCDLTYITVIRSNTLIHFTIKSSFTVQARKQNDYLEKEPKENSAGSGTCLKLSGRNQLANPHFLYLGQGFFWPAQHGC